MYIDSLIKEIERIVERIEEKDNEFMNMMNWYDSLSKQETHSEHSKNIQSG